MAGTTITSFITPSSLRLHGVTALVVHKTGNIKDSKRKTQEAGQDMSSPEERRVFGLVQLQELLRGEEVVFSSFGDKVWPKASTGAG